MANLREIYEKKVELEQKVEASSAKCEEILAKAKQDNADAFDELEQAKADLKAIETEFADALFAEHKAGNDVTNDGTIKVRKSSSYQSVEKNILAKKADGDAKAVVDAIAGVQTKSGFATYYAALTAIFLEKGKYTNTDLTKIEATFKTLGFNDAEAKTLASAVVIKDEKENLSYEPSTTATATATADTTTAVDDLF